MFTLRKFKQIALALCFLLLVMAQAVTADEKIVSLNKASLTELKALFEELDLPEELANSIEAYRKSNGPFKTPEDLIKVPGMTQDLIEEINPQVIDGDVVYDPDAEPALAPSKC